ncbi:peptide deformylase [Aquicoccus porphyridii]|uniref:Peptide deformylase n=1 Tax=Aquicoccus porphyridii TaxID=1852029 RepID=A0A5A9YZ02_9RHOB|nr:peptide deformylase [Aquicoccus porphyridii]KAA0910078.1 peptide deformylase [Aquicoccus porphyridii]RAI53476.1 peptide deformylase [Rhodobacteraceae bacterium AsT-22]
MSVLPILTWPDKRLTQRCDHVGHEDLRPLIADMFDTMYAAKGRGLAAPQVGVMKRLFVFDTTWKEGDKAPMIMIDPVVIACERVPVVMEEMCLSIPGLAVPVERHKAVTMQWTDATGDIHMGDFDGAEARVIQHEFDHLNGLLHFDRIDPALRDALEKPWLAARA